MRVRRNHWLVPAGGGPSTQECPGTSYLIGPVVEYDELIQHANLCSTVLRFIGKSSRMKMIDEAVLPLDIRFTLFHHCFTLKLPAGQNNIYWYCSGSLLLIHLFHFESKKKGWFTCFLSISISSNELREYFSISGWFYVSHWSFCAISRSSSWGTGIPEMMESKPELKYKFFLCWDSLLRSITNMPVLLSQLCNCCSFGIRAPIVLLTVVIIKHNYCGNHI